MTQSKQCDNSDCRRETNDGYQVDRRWLCRECAEREFRMAGKEELPKPREIR